MSDHDADDAQAVFGSQSTWERASFEGSPICDTLNELDSLLDKVLKMKVDATRKIIQAHLADLEKKNG